MQKNNSKQFMKLNVKHLKKKSKKNLWDLGLGKAFLDLTPQGKSIKGKTDNVTYTNVKNFYMVKTTTSKTNGKFCCS